MTNLLSSLPLWISAVTGYPVPLARAFSEIRHLSRQAVLNGTGCRSTTVCRIRIKSNGEDECP